MTGAAIGALIGGAYATGVLVGSMVSPSIVAL